MPLNYEVRWGWSYVVIKKKEKTTTTTKKKEAEVQRKTPTDTRSCLLWLTGWGGCPLATRCCQYRRHSRNPTALPPSPSSPHSRFLSLRLLLLGSHLHLRLPVGLVLAEEQHVLGLLFHAPDIGPVGLPLPLLEFGYGNVRFPSLCFLLQCLTEGCLGWGQKGDLREDSDEGGGGTTGWCWAGRPSPGHRKGRADSHGN